MALTPMAAAVAARPRGAGLTYGEVAQTAGVLPLGYHHLRRIAMIGTGSAAFAEAADSRLNWQAHLRAGTSAGPP